MSVAHRYIQLFVLLILVSSWIGDTAELPILEIKSSRINTLVLDKDAESIFMSSGSQILVWDISKKQILKNFDASRSEVTCIDISLDGNWIVAGYASGEIALWNTNTAKLEHLFNAHDHTISKIKIHFATGIIASGDDQGYLKTWDLSTAESKNQIRAHQELITSIDISSDGASLVSASQDATAKILSADDLEIKYTLVGHLAKINTACFLNESIILTGSNDKTISAWNRQTGEITKTLLGHQGNILSVQDLSHKDQFISSSDDGEFIIWDKRTMKEMDRFNLGKEVSISHADLKGSVLVPLHKNQTISLWDYNEQKKTETINISSSPILTGQTIPEKNIIVTGDENGNIRKHQLSNGDLIQFYKGHDKEINKIASSKDGEYLATSAEDKLIKIWNTTSGELLKTLEGHKSGVLSISFSEDGQFLFSGGKDKVIKWWNLSSGLEVGSIKAHSADITELIPLSATTILSVSKDRKIKIHDIENGTLLSEVATNKEAISCAVYAERDSLLHIGDISGTISSYHIGQKLLVNQMRGHSAKINHLCLSEDGTYLLSASDNNTSILWDLPSQNLEQTFAGHKAPLNYCSFGKDEASIITTSMDKQIKVWAIQQLVQR